MNNVITVDCPQCGLPAQQDDCITDEERVICSCCGYIHINTIGEPCHAFKGYGVAHYSSKARKERNFIVFRTPISNSQIQSLMNNIKENYDNDSYLSIWNDETQQVDYLVGTKPKTLEQEYKEKEEESFYYREMALS